MGERDPDILAMERELSSRYIVSGRHVIIPGTELVLVDNEQTYGRRWVWRAAEYLAYLRAIAACPAAPPHGQGPITVPDGLRRPLVSL